MIKQILWLMLLPLMVFITYQAVYYVYKYIDRKYNL